uniref:CMP/dCMP-type deaminase domain-containing protein n=1 Tax=viral metagenome TaxID=1070528 RepID=A0A6C0J7C9_9ZZZZ
MSIFNQLLQRRARQGDNGQHRHGAFAVSIGKRQTYMYGFNQIRANNKSIHAELDALRKCGKGTYDIYVCRLNMGCSCPCQNCIERMIHLKKRGINIRRIYYTDGINDDGTLKITRSNFSELYDKKDTLQISQGYRV